MKVEPAGTAQGEELPGTATGEGSVAAPFGAVRQGRSHATTPLSTTPSLAYVSQHVPGMPRSR